MMSKKNISRCFGVEFELGNEVSQEKIAEIIALNSNEAVCITPKWSQSINNKFWHVKYDSTCGKLGKPHDSGWEVATFKAYGNQELLDICKVANALLQGGCLVNDNCGLHVHVDVSDFSTEQMGSLMKRWLKIENFILKSLPQRRRLNCHCMPLRSLFNSKKIFDFSDEAIWQALRPKVFRVHNNPNKKFALNFINYSKYIKSKLRKKIRPTLEFRLPEGTLNFVDVYFWVVFFINFIDFSKTHHLKDTIPVKTIKQFYKASGINSIENSDIKIWFEERMKNFSNDANI